MKPLIVVIALICTGQAFAQDDSCEEDRPVAQIGVGPFGGAYFLSFEPDADGRTTIPEPGFDRALGVRGFTVGLRVDRVVPGLEIGVVSSWGGSMNNTRDTVIDDATYRRLATLRTRDVVGRFTYALGTSVKPTVAFSLGLGSGSYSLELSRSPIGAPGDLLSDSLLSDRNRHLTNRSLDASYWSALGEISLQWILLDTEDDFRYLRLEAGASARAALGVGPWRDDDGNRLLDIANPNDFGIGFRIGLSLGTY